MPKGNAIAAAVLAASGRSGSGSTSQSGGLSPLVASYSQSYSANVPYSPLPRPAPVFLNGAFGPMDPIVPMPINQPREDSGRPDPRRFEAPVGWNLPVGTPGVGKLAPFASLRALADTYSVARSCVDKRKQEIVGLDWDIVPTDEAEQALMGDESARADWEKRRAIVKEFFSHPDADRAKYPTFGSWLNALLEDRFVIDAAAVHLVPPRKKGAGPFGSDLAALNLLDGSTIQPLLDINAATPKPSTLAYQQYLYGVPRVDLISPITDDEADDIDGPVKDFRADQLIYMRETPRDQSPWGFSCVEKALLPISIGLARQQYQNAYFQEGSIPGMFLTPGPDIATPQQVRQLQDALNAAVDLGLKHRIIVLPPGSKAEPMKPVALADQFDEWIISQVAMPFGLTPMDLGVTPRVSAVQTPSESRELSQINSDKGSQTRIEPVCADLKAVLFDYVIQDVFGQKDMQFSWGLTDRGKNRQLLIDQGVELVKVGGKTLDELRISLGDTPYGLPESSVPLIYTATGAMPLQAAAPENALPPGQSAQPGQVSQVPTDAELTTPAHEAVRALPKSPSARALPRSPRPGAKPTPSDVQAADAQKQAAELEILARYLRKGRDLARFRAEALPAEAIDAAARMLPQGAAAAVKAAEGAADAKRRQDRRDRHLEAAAATVAARLGQLVRDHKHAGLSMPHLVDGGVAVMADGYRQAMAAGSQDASDDYDDTPTADGAGIDDDAQSEAEGQRGYLTGLLQDVIAGLSAAAIGARLALYASSLYKAYNASYGGTVLSAHPDYEIIWELGDAKDHCRPCVNRAGQSFTVKTLPGWPGDGEFGGSVCVTGDTLIQAPLIEVAFRRRYEGPVIKLTTAGGRALSCTPNHPVLTEQGWVRADLLKVGDGVVGASLVEGVGLGDPHVQDGPARIDEVFAALAVASLGKGVPSASFNFDVEDAVDRDVEVIRADRELLLNAQATLAEPVGERHLVSANSGSVTVAQGGHLGLPAGDIARLVTSGGRPGGTSALTFDARSGSPLERSGSTCSLGLGSALLDRQLAHVYAHALAGGAEDAESLDSIFDDVAADAESGGDVIDGVTGEISGLEFSHGPRADLFRQRWMMSGYRRSLGSTYLDTGAKEPIADRSAADLEVLRELELRGSAKIALDEVINIEIGQFSGHVFNLQTSSAFYLANGVVTHNCSGGPRCRCSVRFVQSGQSVSTGSNTQLDWSGQYYDQQRQAITAAREQAAQARAEFVGSLPEGPGIRAATRDELRRQVADLTNQRIRAAGGYPGVSVEPQDIPASLIARMLPPGMEGAAGPGSPRLDVARVVDEMFAAKSAVIDLTRTELAAIVSSVLEDVAKRIKVSKESVDYRAATRQGRSCGKCVMFHADGTCDLVRGEISPDATCDRWEPRAGGAAKDSPGQDPSRAAFLLVRARNEAGKWRYLLQKRADSSPHGGMWGLAGGKTHAGEAPWDAAVREAAEELGNLPAVSPTAVWPRAKGDHAVWTYLVDLPRQFTPDGGDDETAGYGWFKRKDVGDLPLHPVLRDLWASLDFDDDRLGGDKPDVAKAARGYELNPHSGMISLDLPQGLIEPIPGGVTDFHITCVYLGPDVDDQAFAYACERAAAAATSAPGPLAGVVSGRGTFEPSGSSDGKTVVWAGVTLPGAEQLRAALEDLSASGHPGWVPHVTRAYIDAGDGLPDPLPATPVTFTHLSVHRGDDVIRYPLGGARNG